MVTGELKTEASASSSTAAGENDFVPSGRAEVSETFTVSGNGSVTAFMNVAGSWDLFRLGGAFTSHNNQASLSLTGGVTGGTDNFKPDNLLATSVVNELLQVTANVVDGRVLTLDASLLSQIVVGQGVVDFSNTATLFVQPSPGVSLTFSDPAFLSDPAFGKNGAVPEPSTLTMVSIGLCGIVRAFSKRRSKARKARPNPRRL